MYPYVLGIHFKSQMLCRLPHPAISNFIPQGFGRVIRHRWNHLTLRDKYYALYRWTDLQRRFNEPITGPNMAMLLNVE